MLPPVHRVVRPVPDPLSFHGRTIRRLAFSPQWIPYNQQLIGAYRVAGAAGQYELYVGVDADPDFTAAPDQVSATLPFSYSVTPPGAGTKGARVRPYQSSGLRVQLKPAGGRILLPLVVQSAHACILGEDIEASHDYRCAAVDQGVNDIDHQLLGTCRDREIDRFAAGSGIPE